MRKQAELLLLSVTLIATALHAAPTEREKALASGNLLASASPSGEREAALERRNPRYQLCKGDSFDLDFPFTPTFNQQTITVEPDGYASLRAIGDLHVEGQTIPELTETLRQSYARILHDPVITVTLKDFDKPYFTASGQVTHPGRFDLRGDITVTEGLAMAGGLTPIAKHSQVLLFRRVSSDWYEVKKINVKRLLHAMDLNEDVHLRPGDMLYVPTSAVGNIKRLIPGAGLGMTYNPHP
ncbi:MAG: polysaccharide biosynthesis/export family protein [Terriglobia bacterium]|jgi:polysaccharide export outer membrane protein